MIDLIAYIAVRALNKILALVPISASLWLGRRIGFLAFVFNRKRRLIAYANLKAAFARDKSPAELKAIAVKVYQNMVQTFIEVLNLTKINRSYVDEYVEVVNMERIRNAAKSGRGTILLTGHFGDWELSNLVSSVVGFSILVLAREQKMKRLNELLNRLRESNGCKVIRKGMSTKNILKALYAKNIVGILSDQDAGRKGVFVDFFGRPTSSHPGPMEIAKHTDSIVLPNFIVRTNGPHHKLYLEECIDFRKVKSPDDIKESLQKFTSLLESYVRRYPEQWLWPHKRWKSTPTRTILILNDGKAGHLNQSLAVARQIQKARSSQGYAIDDTRIDVVEIKYRNSFARTVLSACAAFATWRCHGCMRCMRYALKNEIYNALMSVYAEFVVSCGSGLEAVNIFMSKENNAKNVIVMKPGIFMGAGKFSLAVIPRHDRPPRRGNIVETMMAPNLVSEEVLRVDGERLRGRIGPGGKDFIGLFIGGDNPEFSLTEDIAAGVIDAVLGFCGRYDADLLVTTSRRTSPAVEAAVKAKLKGHPRCRLLVIVNEKNFDETVGGILALSRVAVVSEESISMVSEAVTSAKRVVVFMLRKKRKALTKHEFSMSELEREGYIKLSRAVNLASDLERAWKDTSPVKEVKDMDRIFEAVRRII